MGMIWGEKALSCSGRLGRVLVPVYFTVNSLVLRLVKNAFHHVLLWVKGWVPGYQRKTLSLKIHGEPSRQFNNQGSSYITVTYVLWKIL